MAKNVCMIVQSAYPDVRVRKEALSLVSHGHTVSVIALRYPNDPKQEVVEGIKIYRIGFPKKRSGKFRYMFEYAAFFMLTFFKLNLLDISEKYDVVHVNTLPDFLVFSTLIQKLKGRKIVLDMHEIMPEFFISKFGTTPGHPIIRLLLFLERICLKFADEVITVNEPIKRIFQKRAIPGKPVTIIMNTISTSMTKDNLKRTHKDFNCVYHGTLTDIYSLDTAIESFAKACRKCPDMYFHIFGVGESLPLLKQLTAKLDMEKHVLFHGLFQHDQILEALSEMDLAILATRKDIFLDLSFSNKLAEYVFLKIPVISSDLETTKVYFSDEHILFFESGNVDDLSHKIEFAYANKDLLQIMAATAYEHFKDFSWDVMAKRYREIIERD